MNITTCAIFLLSSLTSQVIDSPPIVSPSTSVIWANPEYEFIHNEEPIRSKIYVVAILSNGDRLKIPVINGLLPKIEMGFNASGHKVRHYYYGDKLKYDGSEIIQYRDSKNKNNEIDNLQKRVTKLETSVEKLENTIKNKSIQEAKHQEKGLCVAESDCKDNPKDKTKNNPAMKKPSEFDQEIRR